MSSWHRNRRVLFGLIVVTTIAVACVAGPWLLSAPPAADPVRGSLLPPMTRVNVIETVEGSTLVARRCEVRDDVVILYGGREPLAIAADRIQRRSSHRYWLGTDLLGRDVLTALLRGGRVSLAVVASSLLLTLVVGVAAGLMAATGGAVVDGVLMRLVDALLAFPVLFLMILAATLVRPSVGVLVAMLGLTSWMGLARLVRGQVMALRARPFVLAARLAGTRRFGMWRRHYLPNIAGPVGQDAALRMGDLVVAEATLSFLGLGVPPTVPTWGSMVADGQRVLSDAWWLATLPGLAVVALVVGLALIADGLREELDRSLPHEGPSRVNEAPALR